MDHEKLEEIIHLFGLIGYCLAFCINTYLTVFLKNTYLKTYLIISCVGYLFMAIYHYQQLDLSKMPNLSTISTIFIHSSNPHTAISKKIKSEKIYIQKPLLPQSALLYRCFAHICLALFFGLMVFHTSSHEYLFDDTVDYLISSISHVYFIIELFLGLRETPGAIGIIFAQFQKAFLLSNNSMIHGATIVSAICLIISYSITIFSEIQ